MKIYVVIDNIRSAYNVGSIFRTADGAGNCELLICGISPTPEHIKVGKTALGADQSVPWKYFKTTLEAVRWLKNKKVPVWSIELTEKAKHYQSLKFPKEVAFVFGHEIEGVNSEVLNSSDEILYIPMKGTKNSLNVASAAAILLYSAT